MYHSSNYIHKFVKRHPSLCSLVASPIQVNHDNNNLKVDLYSAVVLSLYLSHLNNLKNRKNQNRSIFSLSFSFLIAQNMI